MVMKIHPASGIRFRILIGAARIDAYANKARVAFVKPALDVQVSFLYSPPIIFEAALKKLSRSILCRGCVPAVTSIAQVAAFAFAKSTRMIEPQKR
jgi:hypothetical protein